MNDATNVRNSMRRICSCSARCRSCHRPGRGCVHRAIHALRFHELLLHSDGPLARLGFNVVSCRPLQPHPGRGPQGFDGRNTTLCHIHAEDKGDVTHLVPAVQVRCLGEVGVATQQNLLEPGGAAQRDRLVERFRCAFAGRAITWAVHDPQHFAAVGQRHNQWVVAPFTAVRDVHAFFALASGRDHGAVGVDLGLGKETDRLPLPDLKPRLILSRVQGRDVGLLEPA
jgi:hypothetical protein